MKSLNHPNIVKLFEVVDPENILFLVMKHVNRGYMFDYLQDHGHRIENEALGIF